MPVFRDGDDSLVVVVSSAELDPDVCDPDDFTVLASVTSESTDPCTPEVSLSSSVFELPGKETTGVVLRDSDESETADCVADVESELKRTEELLGAVVSGLDSARVVLVCSDADSETTEDALGVVLGVDCSMEEVELEIAEDVEDVSVGTEVKSVELVSEVMLETSVVDWDDVEIVEAATVVFDILVGATGGVVVVWVVWSPFDDER